MMHPLRYVWLFLFLAALGAVAVLLSMYALPKNSVSPPADLAPSGFPANAPTPRAEDTVEMQKGFDVLVSFGSKGFAPKTISIVRGQTIRFTNNSSAPLSLQSPSTISLPPSPVAPRSYAEVSFPVPATYQIQDATTGASISITVQ